MLRRMIRWARCGVSKMSQRNRLRIEPRQRKSRTRRGLPLQQVRRGTALPPVVVSELLSGPQSDARLSQLILALPVLEPHPGYWERAAATRAAVLARKLRARLADTLISQSCIDHRVPLITRDGDFAHFAKHAGLSLI